MVLFKGFAKESVRVTAVLSVISEDAVDVDGSQHDVVVKRSPVAPPSGASLIATDGRR